MRRLPYLFALLIGLVVSGSLALSQGPEKIVSSTDYDPKLDEDLLQGYQIPTDGKGLLDYVEKRTRIVPDPKEISNLIKQLGSEEFQVREQAYGKLMQYGPGASELLKQASTSDDTETKKRSLDLLKQIESEADPRIQNAVMRLIGNRHPAGAGKVLLAYLPFVADEEVAREIDNALSKTVLADGQAEPAVVKALKDQLGIKRRAAAVALARAKAVKQRAELLDLLQDPDLNVRLDVAMALLTSMQEKQAIPAIINILKDIPVDQLWGAESALLALAGAKAPEVRLSPSRDIREKVHKAWQQWWDESKGDVDFTKLTPKKDAKGLYLVIHQTMAANPFGHVSGSGRKVVALDNEGKQVWQFDLNERMPVSVLAASKDELMVFENKQKELSLRDMSGRIKKDVMFFANEPISAQLLPNGNYFAVFHNTPAQQSEVLELDKNLKRKFEYGVSGLQIYRACKPRDNVIVYMTPTGEVNYLETNSREVVKKFSTTNPGLSYWGGLDSKPDGRVLVPLQSQSMVVEYNTAGKAVRRFPASAPSTAVYLPNGNILVGSQLTNRVSEVTPQGRVVWTHNCNGSVFQVQYQ